ncbi:MAG: hypothetical protein WCF78_02295 [archaeon]
MDDKQKKIVRRSLFVLLLLIILLFAMIWTGNLRCRSVPGMCNIYWGTQTLITGRTQPSILIIYDPNDQTGLGNPYLLNNIISDKKHLGLHPSLENINYMSPEKLKGVSLVIVERARSMSTNNLTMFQNYVSKGGRLIWIGDAGVDTKDRVDKYLTVGDVDGSYDGNIVGKWARLDNEGYMIRFDEFLGVSYVDTFCNVKDCKEKTYKINEYDNKSIIISYPDYSNGNLIPSPDHPLVYALKSTLPIRDNFAIVEVIGNNAVPLKIDYGSKLFKDTNTSVGGGDVFPAIVTSNSNKVAYYAIPPEYLSEDEDEDKYFSIIENMIDGMIN